MAASKAAWRGAVATTTYGLLLGATETWSSALALAAANTVEHDLNNVGITRFGVLDSRCSSVLSTLDSI